MHAIINGDQGVARTAADQSVANLAGASSQSIGKRLHYAINPGQDGPGDRKQLRTGGTMISPWNPEPASPIKRRYPYLVIRLMGGVYQREEITLQQGAPRVHIGHRDTYVHHPEPFAAEGAVTAGCKDLLISGVLEAVRRTRFRMCLVWSPNQCTFVERDGSVNESDDPPSGGFGTGGVGGLPLPSDIEFGQRK
jgi:hypothetical protein